jgi:hypothetical protein
MAVIGYFYVKTMFDIRKDETNWFGSAFPTKPFLMLRYDDEKNQYLSQTVLFVLDECEKNLNAGRFEHFSSKAFTNSAFSNTIQFAVLKDIEDMIIWIGENVQNKWSWRYKSFPCNFEFSFENKIDASFFALRWR